MPRRDGTGPVGRGALTGRRLGFCRNEDASYGFGFRRGAGRCYGYGYGMGLENEKDFLEREKEALESHLTHINKKLKNMEE